jgi:hypothetical protein
MNLRHKLRPHPDAVRLGHALGEGAVGLRAAGKQGDQLRVRRIGKAAADGTGKLQPRVIVAFVVVAMK